MAPAFLVGLEKRSLVPCPVREGADELRSV